MDETGWKIDGENRWLWTFISEKVAFFRIEQSRSKDVIKKVLGSYDGTVVTDFYPSFDRMDQQKCIVHLLREMSELAENGDKWTRRMHRKLKKLIMDAIRFKQKEHSREEIQEAKRRFERRLLKIAHGRYRDRDRRRIAKRLRKHLGSMFTFLEVEGLEPHNNAAERGLRESVVIRKISGGNRSEKGARTHEVMMSVMETYGLQGKDFFQDGMEYIQRQL